MAEGERTLTGGLAAMSHPTPADLADLLARVARADRPAFEALYRATSAKLFGVILRILHDRALAEDVLQEAFVRIWENASRFDPSRASPITWMAVIARNRAIDEARRRTPRRGDDNGALDRVVDPTPSPARQAEDREALARLQRCLDGLDGERAAMIRLAYLDGLSRQELADRYRQPVGTVKTWLRRGLQQLRDCMDS